jgi:hypothetical protein
MTLMAQSTIHMITLEVFCLVGATGIEPVTLACKAKTTME